MLQPVELLRGFGREKSFMLGGICPFFVDHQGS